ncbi:MAG TPA: DUF6198 family protein [Methanocorpusculum sp.]|nr:DUF6198 family protein [Methanocorpusculum sp.]
MGTIRIPKLLFFIAGVYFMGLGVALSVTADLGTSPISSLPYVLGEITPFTMGAMTFAMNIVFILIQVLILRKQFKLWYLLQLPGLLLFSAAIDLNNYLLSGVVLEIYWIQFLIMLLGCIVLGFGIALLLKADIFMMPGDFLVKVISDKSGRNFGRLKVCFDVILVAIAVTVSFVFLHQIVGVREGSLVAALTVGLIVNFFRKYLLKTSVSRS